MKKFTVLVDMDNVLENLGDVWVDELNKRHGLSMTHDDIKDWNMAKFYPSLSRTQVFAPLHDKHVWERVEPLPGAEEAIASLKADGHDIVVVTASHPDTVKWKYDWLERYFPSIRYNDIIFSARKQLVCGDFLIDDAPHNLFGGKYTPIMFRAPHNLAWKPKKLSEYNLFRVDDWKDAERLIKSLSEIEERTE